MSWVSENKFLTGFGVVMLAGVGTLGWLTWSAMGNYDSAVGEYDGAAGELKRLQEIKPALTDANLKELLSQKKQLTTKIGALQGELKKRVLPLPSVEVEPAQFQDKLKVSVGQITSKAAQAKVVLPKNFYLDFDKYQSSPPPKPAATVLTRQLQAIELLMEVMNQTGIQSGGFELNEFHRGSLPEEGPAKAETGSGTQKGAAPASEQGPIKKYGLQLKITSSDDALRQILNALANHKQQLFLIRNVSIQNKQQDSPPRSIIPVLSPPVTPTPGPGADQPGAPSGAVVPPVTPPAAPGPGAPPTPGSPVSPDGAVAGSPDTGLSYVFGREQIMSTINIEVLNVEEPKAKSDKGDKKSKEK